MISLKHLSPHTSLPASFVAANVKAVACDMDGTTLLPSHTPSQRTIKAFAALRAKYPNIHILFATGRPRSAAGNIGPLLHAPHSENNNSVVGVYLNGALAGEEVIGPNGDTSLEMIRERPVDPSDAGWYLKFAEERDYTIVVYNGDDILSFVEKDDIYNVMKEAGEPSVLIQKDKHEFIASVQKGIITAHKLAFVSTDHPKVSAVRAELESTPSCPSNTTILVRCGPDRLEVMHTHATKAHALAALCKEGTLGEGVELENIICFGDGENDVEMISEVGMGVAMGNACESVKNVAKYICGTNVEDGVARTLETLFELAVE